MDLRIWSRPMVLTSIVGILLLWRGIVWLHRGVEMLWILLMGIVLRRRLCPLGLLIVYRALMLIMICMRLIRVCCIVWLLISMTHITCLIGCLLSNISMLLNRGMVRNRRISRQILTLVLRSLLLIVLRLRSIARMGVLIIVWLRWLSLPLRIHMRWLVGRTKILLWWWSRWIVWSRVWWRICALKMLWLILRRRLNISGDYRGFDLRVFCHHRSLILLNPRFL